MQELLRRILYVMQFVQFSLASFYDPVRSVSTPACQYWLMRLIVAG